GAHRRVLPAGRWLCIVVVVSRIYVGLYLFVVVIMSCVLLINQFSLSLIKNTVGLYEYGERINIFAVGL
ncbi:hypothetical protein, partial [Flavobacterium sp. UBA6031]|uniref:hypothetical protein n=1 Tax=Flavobacterium sp. UBA6031 TaxID=1946551 RepID=UPI0025C524AE